MIVQNRGSCDFFESRLPLKFIMLGLAVKATRSDKTYRNVTNFLKTKVYNIDTINLLFGGACGMLLCGR